MVQMENQTNLECCSFFGSAQEHVANNKKKVFKKYIRAQSAAQKGGRGENICCEKVQPIRMNSLTMGA